MAGSSGSLGGVVPRPLRALPTPRYPKAPSGTFDMKAAQESQYETKNNAAWDYPPLPDSDNAGGSALLNTMPNLFVPRQDPNLAHHPQAAAPYPYQFHPTHQPSYMQGPPHQYYSSDTADYQ